MKKKLFVLAPLLLFSCATNDIITEQNEVLPEQNSLNVMSKLTTNIINSNEGIILMNLNIPSAIQHSNGGCPYIDDMLNGIYVTTRAFGPDPAELLGYTVRGYGRPRRSLDYYGIRFRAENKAKTIITRGQTMTTNDPISEAISIEHPFEANATYEITLTTQIEDYIYRTKNDTYNLDDDMFDINQSEAFPIVAVELSNSPIIIGNNNPCADRPIAGPPYFINRNYYKTQKSIITNRMREVKEFTFNFSTIESKNSLLIYFIPETETQVLKSSFHMFLKNIKIIKKPFDPTHVVNTNLPCDNKGGFRCP